MSFSNMTEVIEFSVRDMGGNSSTYKAGSIEELRMQLAIQAGVLSPCILLFKRSGNSLIEDAHKIDEVFDKDMPPHEVNSVNNLEGAKKGVSDWSATKWIHAFKLHVRLGDQNAAQHAKSLISVDKEFHEKIRQWVVDMINNMRSYEDVDKCAEDIKAAIGLGLDVRASGGHGLTLLHRAALNGHVELLYTLLGAGGDVNVRDEDGWTPLWWAANWEHVEAARTLLKAGADPSLADNEGRAPIHWADMVILLIDAGMDVNVPDDENGATPLHEAARSGRAGVIRILIRAGANVDARTNDGNTPFHLASDEECRRALQGE